MPASTIRLLVLDVDGVLTDGKLYYGPDGEALKAFHVRDGLGIRMAMKAGIEVAVISGRASPATATRLRELGVRHVTLACPDKLPVLQELQRSLGIPADATAVVGDDVPDLEMMGGAGLKVAVGDAHADIKRAADWITSAKGGRGAVREVCDALLGSGPG
jgi:3-deoxy-D-manno-octulosonate 8-phosphate phosphatase (KDO 8-P phosphatase)